MQTVHDLLNATGPIPPMQVKDVDIRRSELLQRRFDRHVHRLDIIADEGNSVRGLYVTLVVRGILQHRDVMSVG